MTPPATISGSRWNSKAGSPRPPNNTAPPRALEPDRYLGHHNLANALAPRPAGGGIGQHWEAARISPDTQFLHHVLGLSLAAAGRDDEALKEFPRPPAVRITPGRISRRPKSFSGKTATPPRSTSCAPRCASTRTTLTSSASPRGCWPRRKMPPRATAGTPSRWPPRRTCSPAAAGRTCWTRWAWPAPSWANLTRRRWPRSPRSKCPPR